MNQTQWNKIEEEFNKEFPNTHSELYCNCGEISVGLYKQDCSEKIKSFLKFVIEQAVADREEEILKIVKKEIEESQKDFEDSKKRCKTKDWSKCNACLENHHIIGGMKSVLSLLTKK